MNYLIGAFIALAIFFGVFLYVLYAPLRNYRTSDRPDLGEYPGLGGESSNCDAGGCDSGE